MVFVAAGVNYKIINVNGIEVKNEDNLYHWDRGEHSYYMVANDLSEESLFEIVEGISMEISDGELVKECLMLRGN